MDPMLIWKIIFLLPAVFVALTVHELCHGWAAWQCGDPTAKYEGRLTLNPIKHMDPLGTTLLVLTTLFTSYPMGWAKPVPVVGERLQNGKISLPLVALAGPASNIAMACIASLLLHTQLASIMLLYIFLDCFIKVNIGLALFNLIPVPPLDGWRILSFFLPYSVAQPVDRFLSSNYIANIVMFAFVIFVASKIIVYPYMVLYQLLIPS